MHYSIVTPSYRSSRWLPLCIASVADQGVEVEHIVQDACSDDGTRELLLGDSRVKAFIEKDRGMYDAVNRGLRRSQGEVLAYLNADEQLLPGALRAVADYFDAHPAVDVVLSDTIVTDPTGDRPLPPILVTPGKNQLWVRLPVLSCALFPSGAGWCWIGDLSRSPVARFGRSVLDLWRWRSAGCICRASALYLDFHGHRRQHGAGAQRGARTADQMAAGACLD